MRLTQVDLWNTLQGDKILGLFGVLLIWALLCAGVAKQLSLSKKSAGFVASAGCLLIFYFWMKYIIKF
ncbi:MULTISPECIES: hypothetical protein [Paenibacillus]|uniref:Uncharacterized protein n=1 Tax=Paenibacillus vini TaxID=1476024 RepID=A0ABQ4MC85_9BACL|nr:MULTISPECIES: hypothetical protein [Paenibacillus]MBQ4898269.1 hypothetical protein [Paenibacillus sp. Marseille-P2973]MDN4071262.1 hypothetical protein [Paenibacillus vini]GIP53598.1 hypothetical protein J42TS3_26330 [Paenibacillus vini]